MSTAAVKSLPQTRAFQTSSFDMRLAAKGGITPPLAPPALTSKERVAIDKTARTHLAGKDVGAAYFFMTPNGGIGTYVYKESFLNRNSGRLQDITNAVLANAAKQLKDDYPSQTVPEGSILLGAYFTQGRFAANGKDPFTHVEWITRMDNIDQLTQRLRQKLPKTR